VRKKLYGLTKEEAIGHDINSLLKTEFPQPLEKILKTLKVDGKWSGEIVHTCKNGDKLVVQSFWLAKLVQMQRYFEMLESNVDITQRIELQLSLKSLQFGSKNTLIRWRNLQTQELRS